MKKLYVILSGVLMCVGVAWAQNRDTYFVEAMRDYFVKYYNTLDTGVLLSDDSKANRVVTNVKNYWNDDDIMDQELKKWMINTCKKMQSFVRDNNMNFVINSDKYNIKDLNFLDVDCDADDKTYSVEIAEGIDMGYLGAIILHAASRIDDLVDIAKVMPQHIPNLQKIAELNCAFEDLYMWGHFSTVFTLPKAECQVDGRCLVTQEANYSQYAVCCKIDYNPFDFDYDDRTGIFTLKAEKSAPNVVIGANVVLESGDVSLTDFDEQCQLKN